ncbi:MAG: tRNA glutamyl-Q(34) synthetase GluQRS [Allosphingosinicella sp.]|uniref:tRNA glutamyl-Q(34) synthetase GluQRS n=1 Tax=Allosphingosinicella sp. TaxID=2823234 RepID=UPI003921D00C
MRALVTRFAPSPTGRLHLGHAYSAILAHDAARDAGGQFLLRIEDIDPGRSRAAFVDGIIEDLLWLGLQPDGEIVYQSERLPFYAAALDRLKAEGLVYPCFCTRSAIAAEVAASASAPHGPDGPHYPGICRRLSPDARAARMAVEPHSWRLDVGQAASRAGPFSWHDEHAGEVAADPACFGDVVLARKDAPVSYHLAVTVDDADQGVTHVIRGRDLFAATHVHRLLQALLGLPVPLYRHHGLLIDAEGRRLAKRHGAPTIADLRAGGADPAALAAALRMGQMPGGYSLAST